jgi:DDE family transposase
MFVREKRVRNRDGSERRYLQLVENYRVEGRVRQRVVANLGRLDRLRGAGELDRLVASLARYAERTKVVDLAEGLRADWAREWGIPLVCERLLDELGVEAELRRGLAGRRIRAPLADAVLALVANRVSEPASKLGCDRWLERAHHARFQALELQHLYRACDLLCELKDELELALWDRRRTLFEQDLELVFFDTTTTYFEGERLEGFARFGHSKDRRPDRLQLVVGILCTRAGIPIAHRVFAGNTSDVDAFLAAIRELKERFQVKRVVVVSDRGTVGKRTLEALQAAGFDSIVGVRLRKLKAARAVLARAGRYREVASNLRVKQVVHEGVRYIVCHNPEAAAEDARERAEIVAHLEQALGKGQAHLVGNRGYRRYLRVAPGALALDRSKIDEDARYDGKWVLRTSTDLPADEVALAYKSLWQAERLFRTVKGPLSWRPVYLWTEKRVRGHLLACFLALVCEAELFLRLAAQEGERPSYPEVVSDLKALSAIDLTIGDQRYLVRTELRPHAHAAFQACGLRPPPRLQPLPAPA